MLTKPVELHRTIEAAAEAAHDTYYHITPDTSDMGYAFLSQREKQHWREVVLAVLGAVDKS
jgi:hypothetical protein